MAKPLKTGEILSYLIKNYEKGKNFYTLQEICKTLSVSQKTVIKIKEEMSSYLKSPEHNVSDLKGKDDMTLNGMLSLSSKTDSYPTSSDFELLISVLENPEENAKKLLGEIKTDLKGNEYENLLSLNGIPVISSLSPSGMTFLRSCSYSTFNFNLHHYCQKKGYSDRFKYKPGEILEIGAIPSNPSIIENKGEMISLKKMESFIFYAYLPFSRKVSLTLIDAKKYNFTAEIITSLIFFLFSQKGLPEKIIGNGRITEILDGADIKLIKNFLDYCGLIYSSNTKYCTFISQESKLIENVIDSLAAMDGQKKSKNGEKMVNTASSLHNKEKFVIDAYKKEAEILHMNKLPSSTFTHNIGVVKRQKNNHVFFRNHYYSSYYTCENPFLSLVFDSENVKLIMKNNINGREEIISTHTLCLEESSTGSRYTTLECDLAPDTEAEEYGLWTREEIINNLWKAYSKKDTHGNNPPLNTQDSVIEVANRYIDERDYPQQAYILINSMRFKKDEEKKKIREGCIEILKNGQGKVSSGLIKILYGKDKNTSENGSHSNFNPTENSNSTSPTLSQDPADSFNDDDMPF